MVKIEWGFDLTDFGSAENFKQVLKENKLLKYKAVKQKSPTPREPYYYYTWSNPKVKLITGNNPITGIYSSPKSRKPEKGYASYIGVVGEQEQVMKVVQSIKSRAKYIKDESPHRRDFI